MQLEDSPNPTMIEGDSVTGLHNPGEFSGGEGVREGKPDDLVLDMERHPDVDQGRAARMREGPVIQEPDEARALKAPPILPQLMIWDACRVALLGQGTVALENGAQPLVPG